MRPWLSVVLFGRDAKAPGAVVSVAGVAEAVETEAHVAMPLMDGGALACALRVAEDEHGAVGGAVVCARACWRNEVVVCWTVRCHRRRSR